MKKRNIALLIVTALVIGVLFWLFAPPSVGNPEIATDAESIARGAYAYNAAGCGSCHDPEKTGAPIGGYELPQDVTIPVLGQLTGTFHAPNITPDPETGIGGWTGKDFLRALKHGRKPSGGFFYPAFPYRSYKDMTDQDVLDVGAYLMSLPPVKNAVPEHEVPAWQFSWMMAGWNIMAKMMEGREPAIPADNAQIQRGAYLARALGHCGECHTPRNGLGMMQRSREFAGVKDVAPDIDAAGVGWWSPDDFVAFLQSGVTAENEYVGGEMARVIEHTALLTEEDQRAYAAFFTRSKGSATTNP
jgi:mono/diheme cytochrome c family protein